ncbi:hypothetical protein HMPREF3187_00343 [Aerococcus christensenii]|uniref:Uncharacterized protein n=1 Tax=Aerococcus christensenii TaxID=87541 RepID=A0A133Y3L1_9LACT|nr:hypothetical protein HMPREF3187_00343 [Aerococcus christensenii]
MISPLHPPSLSDREYPLSAKIFSISISLSWDNFSSTYSFSKSFPIEEKPHKKKPLIL